MGMAHEHTGENRRGRREIARWGAGSEATMPGRAANGTEDGRHDAKSRRAADVRGVILGNDRLTLREVVAVAREGAQVSLAPAAIERIRAARAVVEHIQEEGRQVYGVTTGFGHLSRIAIPRDQLVDLQHNLIRSHASGVS